ncbi:MAG: 50S ribosomal protein L29 [Flavobacteriales bacterium]
MKANDYTKMSETDLLSKIQEEKAAMAKMKFGHQVAGTENPMLLRNKRREIARMMTALSTLKNNG